MFAHTATASHVPSHRATISSNAAQNGRRDALRAHSKVAWNLFNDLFDREELGLHYGKLLRAHIFCCCGTDSHTKTQQQIAEQAGIPQDRVKDQMRKLEETGWIAHTRKGNAWRTTITAYLPLDHALVVLAKARGSLPETALEYLHTLKACGVRLPWNLPQVTPSLVSGVMSSNAIQTSSAVADREGVPHPNMLITAAREARAIGNAEQAFEILLQAVELLAQERPAQTSSTEFLGTETGVINPQGEGETIHPANHPATYILKNNNPISKSKTAPLPPKGNRSEVVVPDSEATRLLLAEQCEDPTWLIRCATIPEYVISAAIRKVEPVRPKGDRRRPGLILKTLGGWLDEWERIGVWPVPERERASVHDMVEQSINNTDAAKTNRTNYRQLWRKILDSLEQQLPEDDFKTWIALTHLYEIEDNYAIVATPNIFVRQEIECRFLDKLKETFLEVLGYPTEVQLVIESRPIDMKSS